MSDYEYGDKVRIKGGADHTGRVGKFVGKTIEGTHWVDFEDGTGAWQYTADEMEPVYAFPAPPDALQAAHLLILDVADQLSRTDISNAICVANGLGMILAYIQAHNAEYDLLTLRERTAAALKAQEGA